MKNMNMEMNITNVPETPVYEYITEYDYDQNDGSGRITLYRDEVFNAPIGHTWSIEDVDRYPNARTFYKVKLEKVYQSSSGALLVQTVDGYTKDLIWIERHPEK